MGCFTENKLHIAKEEVAMNVSRSQDFSIVCLIDKQSSADSTFQVTWFWQNNEGTKAHPIFTSYRNHTLQERSEGLQLRFSHPRPNLFNLTVVSPAPENSGVYFCEVEEWLPSLDRGWMKVAEGKSGKLAATVSPEGNDILM